jgi:hypothetical protein
VRLILGLALVAVLAACDPFGLPSTRALETGAASMFTSSLSYEMKGTYTSAGTQWTVDMQFTQPNTRHITVASATEQVEAIFIEGNAYFRGQAFLAKHLGSDPLSQSVARVAGNAWWKDVVVGLVPTFQELTSENAFRTSFLGPAVDRRIDHQQVDGVDAVELSGRRADVYIQSASPYRLLRIRLREGVVVDGVAQADLRFTNVDRDFAITAPTDVINFSNLSTLPPIYRVSSIDTSSCGSPCVVSARLKNLGGIVGAKAHSTVTFTMSDPISKQAAGTCTATVEADVGYNSSTSVSCTINARPVNGAVVTATVDNPGRA